ncbi:PilZ domain-containing protein [Qipengyuania sp. CAU 1752]
MDPCEQTLCQRAEPRVQFFVAAALHCAGRSVAVKIRNFSSSGTRIEGELIPPEGAFVELRRGMLAAKGMIVWRDVDAAGIDFDTPADVFDWMPGGGAPQARVDQLVDALRQGCDEEMVEAWDRQDPVTEYANLAHLAESLDELANLLSTEPAWVEKHGDKLQILDLAAQRFRKIAAR